MSLVYDICIEVALIVVVLGIALYIYWRRRKSAKEESKYAVEFSSTRDPYCSSVYTQDLESVISVDEYQGTQRYNPFQTPVAHVADGNAVSSSNTDGAPPAYAHDEKSGLGSPISPPPSAVTRQPRA